jgi:hypothetical protein
VGREGDELLQDQPPAPAYLGHDPVLDGWEVHPMMNDNYNFRPAITRIPNLV